MPRQILGFGETYHEAFWSEALRKAEFLLEKLFVISMDETTTFHAVLPVVLSECQLERDATEFAVETMVRENLASTHS